MYILFLVLYAKTCNKQSQMDEGKQSDDFFSWNNKNFILLKKHKHQSGQQNKNQEKQDYFITNKFLNKCSISYLG